MRIGGLADRDMSLWWCQSPVDKYGKCVNYNNISKTKYSSPKVHQQMPT